MKKFISNPYYWLLAIIFSVGFILLIAEPANKPAAHHTALWLHTFVLIKLLAACTFLACYATYRTLVAMGKIDKLSNIEDE